jgi:hypothetical protein
MPWIAADPLSNEVTECSKSLAAVLTASRPCGKVPVHQHK